MPSLNKVQLIGHLGQDPEMRFTAEGTAVATFSVATQYKETTEWHRIVVWSKQAENCVQYIQKGSLVYVEGRLQTRSWESDGQRHTRTEIVANQVTFLDRKGNREEFDGE